MSVRRFRAPLRRSFGVGCTPALLAMFPAVADAAAIPGATYTGTAADGATISFTIAADGTIAGFHKISGAQGKSSSGGTCQILGEGDVGNREGVPIVDNAFGYSVSPQNLLHGTFSGAQSASGTFRPYNPAAGPAKSCDTWTVSWTASTTASPSSAGGSRHGKGRTKPERGIRVTILEASAEQFDGGLISRSRLCSARRVITIWAGVLHEGTTPTRSKGTFTFPRTLSMNGPQGRTSVSALSRRSAICAAASSAFIGS